MPIDISNRDARIGDLLSFVFCFKYHSRLLSLFQCCPGPVIYALYKSHDQLLLINQLIQIYFQIMWHSLLISPCACVFSLLMKKNLTSTPMCHDPHGGCKSVSALCLFESL